MHMQVAFIERLIPPAIDLNVDRLGQLPAEIFNVNSSPTVHIRGILSCHQTNSQANLLLLDIDLSVESNRDTSYANAFKNSATSHNESQISNQTERQDCQPFGHAAKLDRASS